MQATLLADTQAITIQSGTPKMRKKENFRNQRAKNESANIIIIIIHPHIRKNGLGLQFAFGLGAMMGLFLFSFFMDFVGPNGFFIYLIIFHASIGIFGVYRMKIRAVVDNPDSQFTPMPQTITPLGMELNPVTEHIDEPYSEKVQKMLKRKGVVIKKKDEAVVEKEIT